MKEVKNKFRERDEIEVYFSDAKKRNFPIGIIFILLILIIIGGVLYYFFVIDSPQNIFLTYINQISNNTKTNNSNYEKLNIDFSLDLNLITNKKDYVELTDIINEISLNGKMGIDLVKRENYSNIKALYEETDLFGLTSYITKDNLYLKLDNIFDKVLKDELTEKNKQEFNDIYNNYNNENDNSEILSLIAKHLKSILKEAKYQKEYLKQNKNYVKKITLTINQDLIKKFCNNLINDSNFMNEYSKSLDITKEELEKQINEIKNEFKQDDTIEISLYLSIINNDFIELELIYNDIRITLTKENNEINYKYYDSLIIKYQGYISIKEENEHYQVSFSIEDIEQEMTIELKTSIKLEFNQDIDILDTNNAVDINSLTEDDYNKITTNISNNENLKNLLEDFISLFAIYAEETNYLQTT